MKIVFSKPDGSIGIITPSPQVDINDVMEKDVPAGASNPRIIRDSDLPTDRVFREAWTDSGGSVSVDVSKAKTIAHRIRRAARAKKLEPLDKEQMFVTTDATRESQILSEKQAIMDANASVQTAIDSAASEKDIKAALANL